MAQSDLLPQEPVSPSDPNKQSLWRRILGQKDAPTGASESSRDPPAPEDDEDDENDEEDGRAGLIRRVSRKVVPGLPRAQTFKRQQSELRDNLEPHEPTPAERRAVSVDRRVHASIAGSQTMSNPRTSAPDFLHNDVESVVPSLPSLPQSPIGEKMMDSIGDLRSSPEAIPEEDMPHVPDTISLADAASMTTSQYDALIHEELEHLWILNLSMHFRDKSKREKFFVTYRERDTLWRRVTISLDYRSAPDNSLEMDLLHTKFQRDKSAKIYEAIRESLVDIQFYDTVTNLKLQTTDGRLHVHVVEDVNEIIHYPTVRMISHLRCRRIKEQDIEFDSHMSGFVYKVRVNGETLIKKEIPGPDTVDEFLYEINALNRLRHSHNVIRFYGVIVDDNDDHVKGLLIDYAEQGALIDVIFDHDHQLSWPRRERWARQIVEGLSEIHEAGFVQGDFTLSNIVIDDDDNAKIIDINRRGCPVGWEPPEATPLIESNQRISMYIGVKSDLYQLGMVLWALAAQEDEPESHGRPLQLGTELEVPQWYRTVVETCLAEDPRVRAQAFYLLGMFPDPQETDADWARRNPPSISVDDGFSVQEYFVEGYSKFGRPRIRTIQPHDWSYVSEMSHTYVEPATGMSNEPYYYPTRGRSPPSPLPSNVDHCESPREGGNRAPPWRDSDHRAPAVPSVNDVTPDEPEDPEGDRSKTPRTTRESISAVEATEKSPEAPLKPIEEAAAESKGGDPATPLISAADDSPQGSSAILKAQGGLPDRSLAQQVDPIHAKQDMMATEIRQETGTEIKGTEPKTADEGGEETGGHLHGAQSEDKPLFRDAGNTEPEVQQNSMENKQPILAQVEGEVQQIESASNNRVAKDEGEGAKGEKGQEEEKVEQHPQAPMTPSQPAPTPSSSSPRSRRSLGSPGSDVPDDLIGCGSRYEASNEEALRSHGSIDDDFGVLDGNETNEQAHDTMIP